MTTNMRIVQELIKIAKLLMKNESFISNMIAKELLKIARLIINNKYRMASNITADYEVTPQDGRKSFYGKAVVREDSQGREVLYSYDTPVLRREKDGTYTRLWDGWSLTTGRHILSWAGINKRQWDNMPVEY